MLVESHSYAAVVAVISPLVAHATPRQDSNNALSLGCFLNFLQSITQMVFRTFLVPLRTDGD